MDLFVQNLVEYPDPVWVKYSIYVNYCARYLWRAFDAQLLFFPEGTRFTKEKHAVSMDFAAKAGLPHLDNLLIPRTKGFFAITQELRHNFKSVYSGTLCFNT